MTIFKHLSSDTQHKIIELMEEDLIEAIENVKFSNTVDYANCMRELENLINECNEEFESKIIK